MVSLPVDSEGRNPPLRWNARKMLFPVFKSRVYESPERVESMPAFSAFNGVLMILLLFGVGDSPFFFLIFQRMDHS